jgi:hypothetical protein
MGRMGTPHHLASRSATALAAAAFAVPVLLASLPAATPVLAAERNSFAYKPPEDRPKGARTRYVETPPDHLLEQMAGHLRGQGFVVDRVDKRERLIIARFTGDPRDYVDCGVVRMLVDDKPEEPPKQYSANRPETRTYRERRGRRVGVLREMQLDARLAVRVEPRGKGARVTTDAIYVLTKMMSRLHKGGEAGPVVDREVASFKSSETGRFKKGTSCVATGRLEDLPTEPFRKAT